MTNKIPCKLDTCNKPLPKGARKFCCEAHSNKYYQNMRTLERQKQKEQEATVRHCAYTKCGKELPKTAHAQKRYCQDTDCYLKQNAINNTKLRKKRKELKEKKWLTCANDNCNERFTPLSMKKYCCKECRNAQNQRDYNERTSTEVMEYEITKEKALAENGNKKEIDIDPKYRCRGNISYNGYTTL